MKKIIKKIIDFFAYLTSIFFNAWFIKILQIYTKKTMWYAVRRKFATVGSNSYIEWPFLVTGPENIHIGENFSALSRFRVEAISKYRTQKFKPHIVIGKNVSFNNDCHIGCIQSIKIGNNVLGASKIYISDHYHGNLEPRDLELPPAARPLSSRGPVVINDNVWIGEGVVILPNVTIGENSIIGANAVVNKNVPKNAVVAGIPAKVIRFLDRSDSASGSLFHDDKMT